MTERIFGLNREQGATLVLVTHNAELAAAAAFRASSRCATARWLV